MKCTVNWAQVCHLVGHVVYCKLCVWVYWNELLCTNFRVVSPMVSESDGSGGGGGGVRGERGWQWE